MKRTAAISILLGLSAAVVPPAMAQDAETTTDATATVTQTETATATPVETQAEEGVEPVGTTTVEETVTDAPAETADSGTEAPVVTETETAAPETEAPAVTDKQSETEGEAENGLESAVDKTVNKVTTNEDGSVTLRTDRGEMTVPLRDLEDAGLVFDDEGLEVTDHAFDDERGVTVVTFNDGSTMEIPAQFDDEFPWENLGEVVEAYRGAKVEVDTGAKEKVETDNVVVERAYDESAAQANADATETASRGVLATTGAKVGLIIAATLAILAAVAGAVLARKSRDARQENPNVQITTNDDDAGSTRV